MEDFLLQALKGDEVGGLGAKSEVASVSTKKLPPAGYVRTVVNDHRDINANKFGVTEAEADARDDADERRRVPGKASIQCVSL